ncbi:MAG: hypothetical protein HQL31_10650 [Planctomycetes bacterium]|nr:hypothetical protein [Planctomycetota bacterium]
MNNHLVLSEQRQIRLTYPANAWWFVITDIVVALTETKNPSDFLKKLHMRVPSLKNNLNGSGQIATLLQPVIR